MACYPGQPVTDADLLNASDPEQDYDDSIHLRPHSTQSTIKWLCDNYHYEDGVCLPRSTIYEHYLDFCGREQLQPVNAASFGKIIRQQFPSLTTRRLGTRGQSKYHYYGLGIKHTSLYFTEEYLLKQQTQGTPRKEPETKKAHPYYTPKEKPSAVLPPFPDVKTLALSDSIPKDKLHTFMVMYRAHCQRILDSVVRANFSDVEAFLLHFWQGMPTHLLPVLASEVVVDLVALCDSTLYHVITNVLIISPLHSFPESIAQEVMKFSSMLKTWLDAALKGLPDTLKDAKYSVAELFTKNLKRQTSLMHLAQAARNALRSDDSLVQLRKDWSALDLPAVLAHTLYAIAPMGIPSNYLQMVPDFLQEFAEIVQDKSTVEDFVVWIEELMSKCVHQYTVEEYQVLKSTGRTFLLTWKFFTSKIVREFTLQSAPSFGTFHLIHMLLDDYIVHTLESILEKQQEKAYSERISVLKLEHTKDIPVEEEQYPGLHEVAAASLSLEHRLPSDFSLHQDQDQLHLPSANMTRTTLSAAPSLEDLHSASEALTSTAVNALNLASILSTSTPLPLSASTAFSTPISSPPLVSSAQPIASMSHGQNTSHMIARTTNVSSRVATVPLDHQLEAGVSQPGLNQTIFHNSLSALHPQTQSIMFGGPTPPSLPTLLGNQSISLPVEGLQLGVAQSSLTNITSSSTTAQMPLSHAIPASLSSQVTPAGAGLPLLPAMYPYASYGGLPQGLQPQQPVSSGMIRVNAPPFPAQSLMSGYPSYISPSLYSGNTQPATTNFSSR